MKHKGVDFHKTSKGVWIFNKIPPCGGHWARYFKDDEETNEDTMISAIDRMLSGQVMYKGDLRAMG